MKTWRWILFAAACVILLVLVASRYQYLNEPVVKGVFPIKERWRFEVDGEIVTEPSGDGSKVVIRTRRKVYALDARTGSRLWDVAAPSEIYPSPPLTGNGQVVIGYQDGVKALNVDTGQVMWVSQNPTCAVAPVVPSAFSETMVYVVRYNCDIQAYDRETGTVVWEDALPGARSGANLFLDDGKIYLVITGGILQVRDSVTGKLIEEIKGQIDRPATFQAGILYGFNDVGKLVAFDTRTETVLWQSQKLGESYAPLLAGQRLLAPTNGGQPMAFDAQTGNLLWAAQTDSDRYQTPAVLRDIVYIRGIATGKIYALSIQNGVELGYLRTVLARRPLIWDQSSTWRPVTAAGLLIVPVERRVYAYGD